jgi:CheY-like chemotaxis protein
VPPPSPKRILVVEDDDAIREELVEVLSEDPALVVSAVNDGLLALRKIASGALWPDAILLDLMMPNLDGDAFLDALAAINRTPEIPVIVMTALPDPSVPAKVRGRARSILFKPFSIANLTAALDAALAQ